MDNSPNQNEDPYRSDLPEEPTQLNPTPPPPEYNPPQQSVNIPQHPVNTPDQHRPSTAVNIVLEWLCYGLWEWALIAIAVLLTSSLDYFFNNSNNTSTDWTFVIYVLATVVCLLPLAYVTNYIYTKREIVQKHGFSAVVMVLHAVGVFLATIAALITLVVSVLSLFTNVSPSPGTKVVIFSSLIVLILGAALFARIINPSKLAKFTPLFPLLVLTVAVVAVVLAGVGPFRSVISNRQNQLIDDNISTIDDDIQTYVSTNNKLPSNLNQLDFSGGQGEHSLVNSGLVTYQIKSNTNVYGNSYNSNTSEYTYQLCANYKKAEGSPTSTNQNQSTYIDTTDHYAGVECYNLTADDYSTEAN